MTTQQERAELRELAEAATPGPWAVYMEKVLSPFHASLELSKLANGTEFTPVLPMVVGGEKGLCTATTGCGPTGAQNAAYIAAANPAKTQELLDDLDRLTAAVEQYKADAERLKSAGAPMANTMFNLAQTDDKYADLFKQMQTSWDVAMKGQP